MTSGHGDCHNLPLDMVLCSQCCTFSTLCDGDVEVLKAVRQNFRNGFYFLYYTYFRQCTLQNIQKHNKKKEKRANKNTYTTHIFGVSKHIQTYERIKH